MLTRELNEVTKMLAQELDQAEEYIRRCTEHLETAYAYAKIKRQEFKDADRKEGNQKAYVKWSLNRLPVYYICGLRQHINVAEFDEGDTFEKTKKKLEQVITCALAQDVSVVRLEPINCPPTWNAWITFTYEPSDNEVIQILASGNLWLSDCCKVKVSLVETFEP